VRLLVLSLTAAVGCGPKLPGEVSAGAGTTMTADGPSSSGGPPTTTDGSAASGGLTMAAADGPSSSGGATTTGVEETSDGTTAGATSSSSTGASDVPPVLCDLFAQDCPEGQKCAPTSLDDDEFWDSNSCVPVVVDPDQPGEPCMDIGSHGDGLDSCAEGSVCEYVLPTKIGRCMAHCQGSPSEPTCPPVMPPSCWGPDQVCHLDLFNNATTWCYQQLCDPIAQNCLPGGGNA
jgi:hypothetical protein